MKLESMRNPRSSNKELYIDVDILLKGDWVPFTITKDMEEYDQVLTGFIGDIVEEREDTSLEEVFKQVLRSGVTFGEHRLSVDSQIDRERLMAAAQRYSINGTLPQNKDSFNYPSITGEHVAISKEDLLSVSLLVQDYYESCYDHYNYLKNNQLADKLSGWPEQGVASNAE